MADRKGQSDQQSDQTDQSKTSQRKEALWKRIADHIADDAKTQTTNGNRESLDESKSGSAQRGGPDIEKANARQPPDSFVRDSEE